MATRVEVEKCKNTANGFVNLREKKNTFYRALYRYKMNGYKGARVPSFYSGFFYVDYKSM